MKIMTMEETLLSLCILESKCESMEWKLSGECSTRKMRSSTSHRKSLMLSVFWDAHGILLMDFAKNCVKINKEYYSNLVELARRKRRKSRTYQLYFLHNNAPVHTSEMATTTISASGMELFQHPPNRPFLAPSDYYLFNHLKKALRGNHFADNEDLIDAVNYL